MDPLDADSDAFGSISGTLTKDKVTVEEEGRPRQLFAVPVDFVSSRSINADRYGAIRAGFSCLTNLSPGPYESDGVRRRYGPSLRTTYGVLTAKPDAALP